MASLFRELQSGRVKLFVAGAVNVRELEVEPLIGGTLSYPPDDPFHSIVIKNSAAMEVITAEEIFLAREGISLEGLESKADRDTMDDRFNEVRLKSPSPQRFGFELHSDDGRRIEAVSIEAISAKPIKSLYDADHILVTGYSASVDEKGDIHSAEIYPVAIKVYPKIWLQPLASQAEVIANPKLSPFGIVQLGHTFKFKPALVASVAPSKGGLLPGLGAAVKKDGGFGQLIGKALPLGNLQGSVLPKPLADPFASSISSAAPPALSTPPMFAKESPLYEPSDFCTKRFLLALMVLHVMGREKELIRTQTTEPSGTVNAGRKKGKRSGIYHLTVDPDEFALIVSKVADDIERVLKSGRGYSAKGLVLVRSHPRISPKGNPGVVTAHARCTDKKVEAEAKRLLLLPESRENYVALARLMREHGNPQSQERFSPVYKVTIAHPTRNDPASTEAKATREP